MDDEVFIEAAARYLDDATLRAAVACAAAQGSKRLKPREVIGIARALGARPAPVLALMGWFASTEDRPNRRAFVDLLEPKGRVRDPDDKETVAAMAIARTLRR